MPTPTPIQTTVTGTARVDLVPFLKDGWRITGNATQAVIGGEWTMSVSIAVDDPSVVDDPDETATFNQTSKFPNNEATDVAAITAKMQAAVDYVYDNHVPTPGGP